MLSKLKIIFLMTLFLILFSFNIYASDEYSGYIATFTDNSPLENVSLMGMKSQNDDVTLIHEEEKLYKIYNEETLNYYISIGAIESYEPDYYAELFYTPQEPRYNKTSQKYLWNINAQSAWNLGCYGNDVKIAVIDSGIYDHTDLRGAFVGGQNFIETELNENPANAENYFDTYGHGTFVAGIIGAQFNKYLFAGIAPKVKMYSLKCTSSGRDISYSDIIKCIYSAVDDYDCDIINLSLGGPSGSSELEAACLHAKNKGAIICAAVGNEGATRLMYPAAFDCVIGVGSVDYNNEHCSYSQYNKSVYVCAPGGNNVDGQWMWGLNINNGTIGRCGTSFACPIVASAAAIAKNINPNLTHDEFAEILKSTSTDLGASGYDTYYGYGLLNIEAMTKELLKNKEYFISPMTKFDSTHTYLTFFNNTANKRDVFYLWKHDNERSFDILSIDEKAPYEILFDENYSELSGYIIDKSSLKPLGKR